MLRGMPAWGHARRECQGSAIAGHETLVTLPEMATHLKGILDQAVEFHSAAFMIHHKELSFNNHDVMHQIYECTSTLYQFQRVPKSW